MLKLQFKTCVPQFQGMSVVQTNTHIHLSVCVRAKIASEASEV